MSPNMSPKMIRRSRNDESSKFLGDFFERVIFEKLRFSSRENVDKRKSDGYKIVNMLRCDAFLSIFGHFDSKMTIKHI